MTERNKPCPGSGVRAPVLHGRPLLWCRVCDADLGGWQKSYVAKGVVGDDGITRYSWLNLPQHEPAWSLYASADPVDRATLSVGAKDERLCLRISEFHHGTIVSSIDREREGTLSYDKAPTTEHIALDTDSVRALRNQLTAWLRRRR